MPICRLLPYAAVPPTVDVSITSHDAVVQSPVPVDVSEADVGLRISTGRRLVEANVSELRRLAAVVDVNVPVFTNELAVAESVRQ